MNYKKYIAAVMALSMATGVAGWKLIKLFKQGGGRFFCNRERCGS